MLGDLLTRIFLLLFGYVYPALECFKSVEKNKVQIEELRFWCQYWIIIAMLTVLERVGDTFISWLPMYGEAKLAFFIYLWYPKTKGTGYIYETLLRPLVSKHETDIERKILELRARVWDLALYYWQNCTQLGTSSFFQVLERLASQSAKMGASADTKTSRDKKTKKDRNYEPSAPPAPEPFLNVLPSMSKHRTSKWSSRPPPSTSSTINRAVSEPPKSNHVQVRLDEQTEYVQTVDPSPGSESDVNENLLQALIRLRRSKPIQN